LLLLVKLLVKALAVYFDQRTLISFLIFLFMNVPNIFTTKSQKTS